MKTLKIAKYQLEDTRKALLIYYAIIITISIVITISAMHFLKQQPYSQISINGVDFASIIFIFIAGLNSFKPSYKFMQANNISRKSFFKGHIVSIFPIAAAIAAIDIVINHINNLFVVNNSFFTQMYAKPVSFQRSSPGILANFIWSFAALALSAIIGWCISLVYYRCNKIQKTILSLSPVFIVIIVIYLNSLTYGKFGSTIADFFALAWGFKNNYNPYIAALSMSVGFVIFTFLSYLLIRKVPVKE